MPTLGASHLANTREYEVQRQNNFEIYIYGIDGSDHVSMAVDGGFTPNQSNEEITLSHGNRDVKVAGKVTFDSGTVTLKDFIGADMERIIMDWRSQVYDPMTDQIGYAADYKKEARIVECSPDGSIERSWVLQGCWPQTVNPGTLDNTSSGAKQIEVTLSYDLAYRE